MYNNVLHQIFSEAGKNPCHVDNYAMSDAADKWGPRDDPHRTYFILGWKHQREGRKLDDIAHPIAHAAYMAGFLAATCHKQSIAA